MAYVSSLKMKEKYFCETFVDFQLITRRYIPEDRNLLNNNCFHNQVSTSQEATYYSHHEANIW
jgi:hypothetical protein